MDRISLELLNCSERYNDAEHAASMRVTVCAERIFGYNAWKKDRIIKHWKTAVHPGKSSTAIETRCTWEARPTDTRRRSGFPTMLRPGAQPGCEFIFPIRH
jgi:hypothetical protein